jgi:hypothetical protein
MKTSKLITLCAGLAAALLVLVIVTGPETGGATRARSSSASRAGETNDHARDGSARFESPALPAPARPRATEAAGQPHGRAPDARAVATASALSAAAYAAMSGDVQIIGSAAPRAPVTIAHLALPTPSGPGAGAQQASPQAPPPSSMKGRAQLDQRWQTEPPDAAWTQATRSYVDTALADAKVPTDRLLSVDCRTTVCRVDLSFASAEEASSLYDLRQPDFELRLFPGGKEGRDYTVYVAREGEALPEAAAAMQQASNEQSDQGESEAEEPRPRIAMPGLAVLGPLSDPVVEPSTPQAKKTE